MNFFFNLGSNTTEDGDFSGETGTWLGFWCAENPGSPGVETEGISVPIRLWGIS